jgi:hypothetical protein
MSSITADSVISSQTADGGSPVDEVDPRHDRGGQADQQRVDPGRIVLGRPPAPQQAGEGKAKHAACRLSRESRTSRAARAVVSS